MPRRSLAEQKPRNAWHSFRSRQRECRRVAAAARGPARRGGIADIPRCGRNGIAAGQGRTACLRAGGKRQANSLRKFSAESGNCLRTAPDSCRRGRRIPQKTIRWLPASAAKSCAGASAEKSFAACSIRWCATKSFKSAAKSCRPLAKVWCCAMKKPIRRRRSSRSSPRPGSRFRC